MNENEAFRLKSFTRFHKHLQEISGDIVDQVKKD